MYTNSGSGGGTAGPLGMVVNSDPRQTEGTPIGISARRTKYFHTTTTTGWPTHFCRLISFEPRFYY